MWSTRIFFSVVGETYGFAGSALVLSLFALLIWRTLRIVTLAKNLFGALIAGGILAMLMFQLLVNVGMTIGIERFRALRDLRFDRLLVQPFLRREEIDPFDGLEDERAIDDS